MKNIITIVLLLFACVSFGQPKFQATIKKGNSPNTVIIAMKPDIEFNNRFITTLVVAVAVPATVTPKPTVTIKTNFITPISYVFQDVPGTENIDGVEHYVYNFLGDGGFAAGQERNYIVGDNNVFELEFLGGPPNVTSEVKIVNLPDGGKTLNSFWNIFSTGVDITNEAAMFYGGNPVNDPLGYSGLSYTQVSDILLPVDFKSFYATKSGDDAKLTWNVSGDEKNSHFDVLRSTDGRNFTPVQKIPALRNGRSDNSYEAMDMSLSKLGSREVFYQIKQTDVDGQTTTSAVRKLSVNGLGKAVAAFPNPAKTTTKLTVDAPESGKGAIIMRDNLGRQVQNINAMFNKGINHFDLNVMSLPSGDYNISVMGGGLNETIKIQKIQ